MYSTVVVAAEYNNYVVSHMMSSPPITIAICRFEVVSDVFACGLPSPPTSSDCPELQRRRVTLQHTGQNHSPPSSRLPPFPCDQ